MTIIIKVPGPFDVPGGSGITDTTSSDEAGAVHLPDSDCTIVVLPNDTLMSITIEIAGAFDVPRGTRISYTASADEARTVHIPDSNRTVIMLEKNT